jgi:uncharacterized OB-fold protein
LKVGMNHQGNSSTANTGAAPAGRSLAGSSLGVDEVGRPALIGCVCTTCGNRMFPVAPVCNVCRGEAMSLQHLADHGTIYSYTIVHTGPTAWSKPYAVGYVDLTDGVRVFSHLRSDAAIGQEVDLSTAQIGCSAEGEPITTFVFQRSGA